MIELNRIGDGEQPTPPKTPAKTVPEKDQEPGK